MAAVPSLGRASEVEPRPSIADGAQATGALYERYSRQIFNFCFHKLGSREEAEDAAQTTFLNAFRGIERGVRPELEQAWLFKIAENVCLTRHRSTFRRRRIESPSDFDVVQEVVPSPAHDADTLIRLSDALAEMTDQQRRAILLREWQGLSYREIGEELGLSQAAVETLLFRARRSLAHGLTEAPPQKKRGAGRLRAGIDLGSILAAAKAAFAGSAAIKVAAVAAVATTTAAAGAKVEQVQHARSHAKPVAATVAKTPAPPVHVRRVLSSTPAAAAVLKHSTSVRPARRARAGILVSAGPQAIALVRNRVSDDLNGSMTAPTSAAPAAAVPVVAPAAASVAAAPAAQQAAEPPRATPVEIAVAPPRAVAPTQQSRREQRLAERRKATEQKKLDRGLSATMVPAAAPAPAPRAAEPEQTSPPTTRWSDRKRDGNDHGKRNDRTDRRSKLAASVPAPAPAPTPATTVVAPVEPTPAEPTDPGRAQSKQNDKPGDRRRSHTAPTAPAPPTTAPVVPTTAAPPVATPTSVPGPTPTDHGWRRHDRDEAPVPVAAPATPVAAPAPVQPESNPSGHHQGRHR